MSHSHEPYGREIVLIRREEDDYTMVSAKCQCGQTLTRETTPQGSRPNWQEWQVFNTSDPAHPVYAEGGLLHRKILGV
jgi:hypothetical protein